MRASDQKKKKNPKNGRRVSKDLFTGRWMGTGDMSWSHPVTICTGVMLVIQIGHRCSGTTQASMQIFGHVKKCFVPQFMKCQEGSMTAFSTGSFVFFTK